MPVRKLVPADLSRAGGVLAPKEVQHGQEKEERRRPADRGRHRPGRARRAERPSIAPAGAADAPGGGADAARRRPGACRMMPTLQVRKENEGQWTVRVTWPDGAWQDIPGFEHEKDADDWIAAKLPDWLEERKMARLSDARRQLTARLLGSA